MPIRRPRGVLMCGGALGHSKDPSSFPDHFDVEAQRGGRGDGESGTRNGRDRTSAAVIGARAQIRNAFPKIETQPDMRPCLEGSRLRDRDPQSERDAREAPPASI